MNKYEHLRPPQPPQPRLVNMCAGKRRYGSGSRALAAAGIMELRYRQAFNAYHCPLCNRYHVGHPPKKGEA